MANLEIIVETEDGFVVQLKQGETYITDDGRFITYEQMMGWILDGSLNQHGFFGYKPRTFRSYSGTNHGALNTMRTALLVAATA